MNWKRNYTEITKWDSGTCKHIAAVLPLWSLTAVMGKKTRTSSILSLLRVNAGTEQGRRATALSLSRSTAGRGEPEPGIAPAAGDGAGRGPGEPRSPAPQAGPSAGQAGDLLTAGTCPKPGHRPLNAVSPPVRGWRRLLLWQRCGQDRQVPPCHLLAAH